MRENLKNARIKSGMTQQSVADYIKTSLNQYQKIEYGQRYGSFDAWDRLEELFNVHQRILRENS